MFPRGFNPHTPPLIFTLAYPICQSVCQSVQKVYCGNMADWIWMPFGVVSGVGRGMSVLDEGHVPQGEGEVFRFHWFEWCIF